MPAPIRLGLSVRAGRPDLSDLAAHLDALADLGLDMVELPAYAFDLVIGGRPLESRIADLVAICRDRPHGFTMHGPLSINFMGPQAHLPSFLEATRRFVEICARIGVPHLVLHAGMLQAFERDGAESAYARQRECLYAAGEFAAPHGVTLCIENLFDFAPYVATPDTGRLARELAAVDHPCVRATFDFSHATIHATQHGTDFMAGAVALAPFARHLHLHDSFGIPDLPWVYAEAEANAVGMGDLHLPVGWGSVPWGEIAARCLFPVGAIANQELNMRFWRDRHEAVAAARAVAADFRIAADFHLADRA